MNATFQSPESGDISVASNELTSLSVLIAAPRGFCAGVERAIEIVERALDRFGAPVYVRHEIVHINTWLRT